MRTTPGFPNSPISAKLEGPLTMDRQVALPNRKLDGSWGPHLVGERLIYVKVSGDSTLGSWRDQPGRQYRWAELSARRLGSSLLKHLSNVHQG